MQPSKVNIAGTFGIIFIKNSINYRVLSHFGARKGAAVWHQMIGPSVPFAGGLREAGIARSFETEGESVVCVPPAKEARRIEAPKNPTCDVGGYSAFVRLGVNNSHE